MISKSLAFPYCSCTSYRTLWEVPPSDPESIFRSAWLSLAGDVNVPVWYWATQAGNLVFWSEEVTEKLDSEDPTSKRPWWGVAKLRSTRLHSRLIMGWWAGIGWFEVGDGNKILLGSHNFAAIILGLEAWQQLQVTFPHLTFWIAIVTDKIGTLRA